MELIRPTSFISAVASSKDSLKKISDIIAKYCDNNAKDFRKAYENLDFITVNRILDDTIKELTGQDSVYLALSVFVNKFPQLSPELKNQVSAALSESDKVKAIDAYREQIIKIIDGKC